MNDHHFNNITKLKEGKRNISLFLSNMSKNFENFDFYPYDKH